MLLTYPGWKIAGKLINMNFADVFKQINEPLIASAIMASTVFLLGIFLKSLFFNSWLMLSIQVMSGFILYYVLIKRLSRNTYFEFCKIIKEFAPGNLK